MMKSVRFTVIVTVVLATVIMSIEYLNFTGFCYSDRRYLSDGELIEKAIEYNLKTPPGIDNPKQYASLNDFFALNPNCCFLERDGHETLPEGTWVRLFGWYIAVADVWYRVKENGSDADAYYDSYVALNSCGQVKQRLGPLISFARPQSKKRQGNRNAGSLSQ